MIAADSNISTPVTAFLEPASSRTLSPPVDVTGGIERGSNHFRRLGGIQSPYPLPMAVDSTQFVGRPELEIEFECDDRRLSIQIERLESDGIPVLLGAHRGQERIQVSH